MGITLLLLLGIPLEPANIDTTLLVAVSLDEDDELELDDDVAEFELLLSRLDAAAATAAAAAIAALTADEELVPLTPCGRLVPPPDDELDEDELAERELWLPITWWCRLFKWWWCGWC